MKLTAIVAGSSFAFPWTPLTCSIALKGTFFCKTGSKSKVLGGDFKCEVNEFPCDPAGVS